MEENNVVSIPVVDLEKRRYVGMCSTFYIISGAHTFTGMLNVLDIVVFLANKYNQQENGQEMAASLRSVSVAEVLSKCIEFDLL